MVWGIEDKEWNKHEVTGLELSHVTLLGNHILVLGIPIMVTRNPTPYVPNTPYVYTLYANYGNLI